MGAAFLPHPPDCYLDEAFEEHSDCLCVPRQLSVLLRQSMEDICSVLDGLLPDGWKEQGCGLRRWSGSALCLATHIF